jgi:hypothetical protein
MLGMFKPITYFYLEFDTLDYSPEPQTADIACRISNSSSVNGISQNKTLCEFINVSSFTSLCKCSTHFTLSWRILIVSLPTSKQFFMLVYPEIP